MSEILTQSQVDNSKVLTIFVGLPSSGKSTYIKNLVIQLENQNEATEVVKMKDYVDVSDDDYKILYPEEYEEGELQLMEFSKRCDKVLFDRKKEMLMSLMELMENKVKNIFVDCNNLKRDDWNNYLMFASNLDYKIYFMLPKYGLLYYPHNMQNVNEEINHISSNRKITMNEYYDFKSVHAFILTNKDICGISPHKWYNIM